MIYPTNTNILLLKSVFVYATVRSVLFILGHLLCKMRIFDLRNHRLTLCELLYISLMSKYEAFSNKVLYKTHILTILKGFRLLSVFIQGIIS